jgi:uncharacterized membrane protein
MERKQMKEFYFISVFIHILSACVWIGGMIFLALVLIPSIQNNPEKALLIHTVGVKFRTIGWVALWLILLTGLYNMQFRQVEFSFSELTESHYGKMIFYKLIIFFVTILLSITHDFYIGTKATELWMQKADENKVKRFRTWARWAGRMNLLLALAAAGLGIAIVRGF